jgi:uncharacterized protein YdhG (YjbR/CyaY superfamily)
MGRVGLNAVKPGMYYCQITGWALQAQLNTNCCHANKHMKIDEKAVGDVDGYIASFPPAVRTLLEKIRSTISRAAPEAEQTISYQIPTFKLHGNLVHFAAFKQHIGFYPGASGIAQFKDELSVYKSAKGSVQFPLDKPLPVGLITRMVKFRVKENLDKAAKAGSKRR